ncbi:hypothetical protein [Flavobacterium sp. CSZ]|uniref:hypothetical protein n=1 Tax=Flavobacterium sp. CSZ TaxID=2783791 RepID=UPI00188D6BDB|nr:hypothetical protein [Flavobacterium sp. CSZ]MBF4484442.1 hypothetical protein [Flavobacterium sp. CSZ]
MISFKLLGDNIKLVLIIVLVVAVVWFYKDYTFQKSENLRQTENATQLRKSEMLLFATQILNEKEMNEYLKYQNSDLKKKLDNAGIKASRIESIVSNSYKYQDTTKRETDLSGIVEAVRNNTPTSQEVIDTLNCWTTKGIISYENNKLKWRVLDRQFNNKSDGVLYWERRQWKFLGIKTRLFGKKEFTSKNFDDCGESRIMKIEKKK